MLMSRDDRSRLREQSPCSSTPSTPYRTAFNKLEKTGLIRKVEGSRGYVLNPDGGKGILKPLTAD
jgi:hypothetical protein